MATAGRWLRRNLASSMAVLAVILFVAFGLPAINRLVPAGNEQVGGREYDVGAGVTVVPPPAARVDPVGTRSGSNRATALFLLGPVRYVIVVGPFGGSVDEAAAKLRTKIMRTRGYQITDGERPYATATGLSGVEGVYSAPGRLGRYAVLLGDGSLIEVTVSGAEGELAAQMSRIEASIASIAQQ